MTDQQRGYAAFWKRMSIKMGLSEAAKLMSGGVRGSHLSAFEQGKDHPLTPEQIQEYLDVLDKAVAENPPYVPDDDEIAPIEDEG
ncbi:MAG: helix-turn-helix transcriptional regulator [Thermomicrobiales bacterium]|nr:helix-turn-helix transcriptional regulator [Thermomicrobiales bacterium]